MPLVQSNIQTQQHILSHGTKVFVTKEHRFGTDAMLLSHFCGIKRLENAIDLCSGCGIVALRWLDNGAVGKIIAVELQKDAAKLIEMAKSANGYPNLEVVCRDISEYKPDMLFDLVCCNPPFFRVGEPSPTTSRRLARHETGDVLTAVCKTASSALKDGGRFCICHRPERLVDIFAAMRGCGLEPKRLMFVYPKADRLPYLVLIDARKAGGVGLHLCKDLVIENRSGEHTKAVKRIYGE